MANLCESLGMEHAWREVSPVMELGSAGVMRIEKCKNCGLKKTIKKGGVTEEYDEKELVDAEAKMTEISGKINDMKKPL